MDPEAAAVITPHLLAREKLLWCGRPHDTAALLRWRVVAIVLVGIAALALRALPLESSLAERADINSILLAVLVCVLDRGSDRFPHLSLEHLLRRHQSARDHRIGIERARDDRRSVGRPEYAAPPRPAYQSHCGIEPTG
ncbi:hypothetical protein [Candidatus Binatus sp.]|uniref:hypothetical protein n=1 Tax=Candidatus Binatus sp. TaxID=2811406 RepID=UPI003C43D1E4